MQEQNKLQTVSLFILLAIMLVLVAKLFYPYASVLLWSAILYIFISPWYNSILSKLNPEKPLYNLKKNMLAAVFSIGTVLIVAGICFFVMIKLIGQGQIVFNRIVSFFSTYNFLSGEERDSVVLAVNRLSMGAIDISHLDLRKEIISFAAKYADSFFTYAQIFIKNIGVFAISLIFMSFSLYFFYSDGVYLSQLFISVLPIDTQASNTLLNKFKDVTKHLLKSLFLVALYQFFLSLILYTIFGIEGAFLLALLTFFAYFFPLVSSAIVWLPIGIGLCLLSSMWKGLLFITVCLVFLMGMDFFVRPLFLENKIQIHPFLIFFSTLGGIQLMGINGIILGPMLIILFFTVIDIVHTADSNYTSVFNGEKKETKRE